MSPQPSISTSRITVEQHAPVARIALSHGSQNVIDFQMMEELSSALAQIESQLGIAVIVVSGAGENFSAGVDIPSHTQPKVELMLAKFHCAVRSLAASHKVTIASVRGHCLGGGAELALVCDMAFTAHDAKWGFPEIKLGCYPPVAVTALAAVVGQKRAAELVLTGRIFSGAEAAEIGLANAAVAPEELQARVEEAVDNLKTLSPLALRAAKRALCSWDPIPFEKELRRAEEIYKDKLIGSHDAEEGIKAWMEKRAPSWKGR